ncbi:hypothetical protein [Burkholderia ubonensis]|nr:hypothetical protein [Burkholderia ubonensis]
MLRHFDRAAKVLGYATDGGLQTVASYDQTQLMDRGYFTVVDERY